MFRTRSGTLQEWLKERKRLSPMIESNSISTTEFIELLSWRPVQAPALVEVNVGRRAAVPEGRERAAVARLKPATAVTSPKQHNQDDEWDRNADEPKQNGHSSISSVYCQ